MGDLYQHTQATQISNQLGQHSLDMNEARLNDWTSKTLLYTQKTGTDKANAKSDVYNEAEQDLPAVPIVAKTTATTLRAGRAFGVGAYRGVSQAEGVADSVRGVGRGFMGAYKTLDRAGTAAGSKIFGEGAVAVKDMTGVEGVVGKNLVEAGAGEAFSKVAAKSVAGAGFAIQAGGDAYNLFETGSIFNSKNADGTIQKGTTAFTGGALAPVAAAANIAAAGYNTYETAKADEATKTADSKNVPSKKPPPSVAPPAFAQLGIVSNQNHNPLARISTS